MLACLLIFSIIAVALNYILIGNGLRERAMNQELPAAVGQIKNDVLSQIAKPLAAARAMAANSYLMDWEDHGLSEEGVSAWLEYANSIKDKFSAASVFWASEKTGEYYTNDELGALAKAFNRFIDSLEHMVGSVRQ